MEKLQNLKYEESLLSSNVKGGITFFTPTYNRSKFLHRIYACLIKQTNKSFVWIIVNDGSVDNTDSLVKEFVAKNEIPILYIDKENGGKHSAFKVAFEHCETEYFICMDDDDIYSENAVDIYLKEWENVTDESIGAIRTLTKRNDGSYLSNIPITEKDNWKRIDVDTLTYTYVYKIKQENWTCYKMKALKQIDVFSSNYWMSEQHRFFSEAIWQGRFARRYKCRYVYVSLREFSVEDAESLTRGTPSRQRYIDHFINTFMLINEQLDYRVKNPLKLVHDMIWLTSVRKKLGIKLTEFISHIEHPIMKTAFIILSPLSLFLQKPYIPQK